MLVAQSKKNLYSQVLLVPLLSDGHRAGIVAQWAKLPLQHWHPIIRTSSSVSPARSHSVPPLTMLGKATRKSKDLSPLLPTWETRMKFLAAGFNLAKS